MGRANTIVKYLSKLFFLFLRVDKTLHNATTENIDEIANSGKIIRTLNPKLCGA